MMRIGLRILFLIISFAARGHNGSKIYVMMKDSVSSPWLQLYYNFFLCDTLRHIKGPKVVIFLVKG
jgi:hypothetical protein